VAANQVLYNLSRRGIEFDLVPWCGERGIAVMAYSPLDEGRLVRHRALAAIAARAGCDAGQLALAWALRDRRVSVIPKASDESHVRANRAALDLTLDAATLAALDREFPPPRRKTPLGMI
jgi:diketogulonate reductase-like aldo/keto reductase